MWTSCGLMSSISSPALFHMLCDHCTPTLSPADVKAAPGGPCGKEAQHLPRGHRGTMKAQDSSGRLLGVSAATEPIERPRNKSRQRGRFYSPCSTKAIKKKRKKKERIFPAPTPPLTCILPTTSVITTNKYGRRQTETPLCSNDDHNDSQTSKRDIKRPCRKI